MSGAYTCRVLPYQLQSQVSHTVLAGLQSLCENPHIGVTFTGNGFQLSGMETPAELQAAAENQESITISKREYDGESIIAVDFGPVAGEPSVDIVEETAIVVVDGKQFEFNVPANANKVTVNDGILTIKE